MRAFAVSVAALVLAIAALLLAGPPLAPVAAGEYSYDNRPAVSFPKSNVVRVSPFPAGKRAASVWTSDACWRDCTTDCKWRMSACMSEHGADSCRPHLDACDRSCQRSCRARGGPLAAFVDILP